MNEMLWDKIKSAVEAWAKGYFGIVEMVSYVSADEDEPDRYIVILAARGLADW